MACWNIWDIGGCGCSGGGPFSQTFTVLGCNGLAYPSVVVSVYTASGGILLASGTTNGSGQVTLGWTGSAGAYWVTVTGQSSRFNAFAQSITLTSGGSQTLGLVAATGYQCLGSGAGCLIPTKTTIQITDATTGTVAATYSTRTITVLGSGTIVVTGWWGTLTYNYPGCGGCSATGGYPIDYCYTAGSNPGVTLYGNVYTGSSCPGIPPFGLTYAVLASTFSLPRAQICPTSFHFSGTASQVNGNIYCGSTSAITVTE